MRFGCIGATLRRRCAAAQRSAAERQADSPPPPPAASNRRSLAAPHRHFSAAGVHRRVPRCSGVPPDAALRVTHGGPRRTPHAVRWKAHSCGSERAPVRSNGCGSGGSNSDDLHCAAARRARTARPRTPQCLDRRVCSGGAELRTRAPPLDCRRQRQQRALQRIGGGVDLRVRIDRTAAPCSAAPCSALQRSAVLSGARLSCGMPVATATAVTAAVRSACRHCAHSLTNERLIAQHSTAQHSMSSHARTYRDSSPRAPACVQAAVRMDCDGTATGLRRR